MEPLLKSYNIASLTDHLNTPSSRFRIRQHIDNLAHQNISVTDLPRLWSTQSSGRFFPEKRIRSNICKFMIAGVFEILNIQDTLFRTFKSQSYDAVWISRELIIGYPSFERIINNPIIYDIDDAVFLNNNIKVSGINRLIANAAVVFAGNEYLANYCSQYSSNIFIIPTAVDTDRFIELERKSTNQQFVVGWSGTSSSYKFFKLIEDTLLEFFKGKKDARLKIYSDMFPFELRKLAEYIDYEPWSVEKEISQIQSFDVGIMPLEESDWVKGKCSYKMLLYAACGIPTITSPYGMNKDILSLGKVGLGCRDANEWRNALEYVYRSRDSLSSHFPDCRLVILKNFSLDVISGRIAAAMRSVLE